MSKTERTDTRTLEERAAALRQVIATPSPQEAAVAELAKVDAEIAAEREAAGRAEAEKRLVGISRAYGSLVDVLSQDEQRVVEAATAYASAVNKLNARFHQLAKLRAEANALSNRFGVPGPTLAAVTVPARRSGCAQAVQMVEGVVFADHAHVRQLTEEDEHQLRRRRNYEEVEGTPGYDIITKGAGLTPWPPLTAAQQAFVHDREEHKQREAEDLRRFGDEAVHAMPRTGKLGALV